ncbi:MATE efflux family protein [Penicillium argentinense]|uniref:MATE efflux family protein n=1 Tax=Penicillium argentinense TaxID=1131581 RepID=A0A9W9FN87_9EURO|nr:MATE efflux family protein [Penicillium argentinense]KAJ5103315.1 MATE efflux family protein [Penicillium argentinense]
MTTPPDFDFDRDSVRIHTPSRREYTRLDENLFHHSGEASGTTGKHRADRSFDELTHTSDHNSSSRYYSYSNYGVFSSEKSTPKVKQTAESEFNEETPLILPSEPSITPPNDQDPGSPVSFQDETKNILQNAGPLMGAALLESSLLTVGLINVGQLGSKELGAASIASILANFTGYMIYRGLATALENLCAQEMKAGMHHLVPLHFQRMLCLLLVITVPIMVLWSFAERLLPLVLSNQETAILAGRYLGIAAWGLPAHAIFESGRRYIEAQGVESATTHVLSVCAPITAFVNWLLVWNRKWGFIGAPVALTINNYLQPCSLFLYIVLGSHDKYWNGFSRRAFSNWGPMIRLAISNMIAAEAESLVHGMTTLASSYFGPVALAAQAVLVAVTNTVLQVPFSLSKSTQDRISDLMRAGRADSAWAVGKLAFLVAFSVGAIYMLALSLLRYPVAQVFATDRAVIAFAAEVMPLCAATHFVGCLTLISNGILCGIGKKTTAGFIQTVVFANIALPLGLGSAFGLGWTVWGLWGGALIGFCIILIVQWLILSRVNLKKCIEEVSKNLID